ncbi:DUF1328 domain-containing protein [Halapricum hydrolyticum]|uniref:UPF0391 membrane protein OB914_10245 n=1 Tax=Halapricum hydrolyticum TaxID=2979991 RepID=A0AAE3IBV9_9EURY|nr:DUF1328 domain-containing protein [Halapricum hydrolyticum]MCU4719157.1 DUF1328 domain-containing protein [Halapricum hydrolyticum]MCU4727347.1 DUF1328 domain-containing protein [Halapricum hydrolyticum]
MILGQAAVNLSTSAQIVPLQFGGGFIELAILFLVLAVVAAILGARGIAGLSMQIAKWLVIIFVILAIISFIL